MDSERLVSGPKEAEIKTTLFPRYGSIPCPACGKDLILLTDSKEDDRSTFSRTDKNSYTCMGGDCVYCGRIFNVPSCAIECPSYYKEKEKPVIQETLRVYTLGRLHRLKVIRTLPADGVSEVRGTIYADDGEMIPIYSGTYVLDSRQGPIEKRYSDIVMPRLLEWAEEEWLKLQKKGQAS